MNKKLLLIVIVLALGVLLWSLFFGGSSDELGMNKQLPSDSNEMISQDLASLDLGDLDGDFAGINSDLTQL